MGTINNGATATLQITVTVNAVGTYNTIAQVTTSDQFDPDSSPNNNIGGEDDEAAVALAPAGRCGHLSADSAKYMYQHVGLRLLGISPGYFEPGFRHDPDIGPSVTACDRIGLRP